jgi:predicted nucleic acid-binding protein
MRLCGHLAQANVHQLDDLSFLPVMQLVPNSAKDRHNEFTLDMACTTSTNVQDQEKFRIGAFVRSDSLPQLIAFAASIPAFAPLLKKIARIGVVVDANIIQEELRWRLGRRQKPEARTGLHEAITAGVIIPFAPTFLEAEIEEHVAEIAEGTRVSVDDVRREWQVVRKLLHFYSPKHEPKVGDADIVDPDDLPYIAAADELGLPIYSRDQDYRQMQAPVINVLIDATAKAYARSSSVRIAVMMGSTFTVTLSFEAVTAACRGIKRLICWFDDLHPAIQVAIIGAGIVAFAHPKSRAKLSALWSWLKETATPPVLQAISDLAIQFAEANKTEADAYQRLQDSLPPAKKRSALMHARSVCLAAKSPLTLAEIERQMRAAGHMTRARNFRTYLRRVLLTSGQFQESSPGVWGLIAA